MAFREYLPVYLAVALVSSTGSSTLGREELKTFALEELIPIRPNFYPERVNVQWISESECFYTDPGIGLVIYDAEAESIVSLLDESDLVKLGDRTLTNISKDKKYLLLSTNRHKVYRYSTIAEYSVYDFDDKSLHQISEGFLQAVLWGSGRSLAYVQENNVYFVPDVSEPKKIRPLTTEGVPGEVYFGVTDWIYEEEVFNAAEALWFSPNGTFLAVAFFNDTQVESATYPFYGNPSDINNQYPQTVEFKYPKAGRTNPTPGLRVYRVDDPDSQPRSLPAPIDIVGVDHILGRVNWASDTSIVIMWLNRRQNVSVLVTCDLEEDKCIVLNERKEANGWIDINEPFFDSTGTQMVDVQPQINSDRRFMHAVLFDFEQSSTTDLTPGNFTVLEILGWNQESNTIYCTVSPSDYPWQRQLWAVSGGVSKCLSCLQTSCNQVTSNFAPGAAYGIITCSAFNDPYNIFMFNAKKETFTLWRNNSRLKAELSQYRLPMPLYNSLNLSTGGFAHVRLMLPPNMQPNRKYPMIVRVYAGPGTSRVKDGYELDYSTYLATNRSFIVASIDVMGSNVQGVESMFAVNNALGTIEVTDTLVAIRRLVSLYPFIDEDRVAVWGWSYGGFTTTMMLVRDTEKTLACGAAVAPVTSWLYYDSIYTERYMDTPQNNPLGYLRSDLMLQAEKLRGRKFLLVHGSGDDNVHFQNSLLLAKRLQHADIAFEQMSYTDESHSLLGVSRHFYHTLDHFWTECFA